MEMENEMEMEDSKPMSAEELINDEEFNEYVTMVEKIDNIKKSKKWPQFRKRLMEKAGTLKKISDEQEEQMTEAKPKTLNDLKKLVEKKTSV